MFLFTVASEIVPGQTVSFGMPDGEAPYGIVLSNKRHIEDGIVMATLTVDRPDSPIIPGWVESFTMRADNDVTVDLG